MCAREKKTSTPRSARLENLAVGAGEKKGINLDMYKWSGDGIAKGRRVKKMYFPLKKRSVERAQLILDIRFRVYTACTMHEKVFQPLPSEVPREEKREKGVRNCPPSVPFSLLRH